jgi:exosome complex exonuclease RRP6
MAVDKERLMQSNVVQMEKPQRRFLSDIDNSRERPFRPRIKVKYHAVTALDLTAHRSVSQSDSADDVVAASEFFAHPYETELKRLKYQEWQLSDPSAVVPFNPIVANRPMHFIDCDEDLDELVLSLKKEGVREIGIDLEHHAFRSFQGLTCLMQLSTRDEDYVIDTLLLRSRMHVLGDAFADPTIVKILHGSER